MIAYTGKSDKPPRANMNVSCIVNHKPSQLNKGAGCYGKLNCALTVPKPLYYSFTCHTSYSSVYDMNVLIITERDSVLICVLLEVSCDTYQIMSTLVLLCVLKLLVTN